MTPTLPRGRARKLQRRGGRAKFSRVGREEATEGGAWGVSPKRTQVPAPPSLLLLLDDLGQAGLGRRRRLHPSQAWGRRGTGHAAGISVRLLGAAGLGVLAHGCGQHHVRRDRPWLAAGERARGAAPGHGRSLAGVPVPSPLVLPGSTGRRRDGRGGGSPGGAASASSRGSRSPGRATQRWGPGGVSQPAGDARRPGGQGISARSSWALRSPPATRAPSGSPGRRSAAQLHRVRRRDTRQPAAGRRALASPASRRPPDRPRGRRERPRALLPSGTDRVRPGRLRASPARGARALAPSRDWCPASATRG